MGLLLCLASAVSFGTLTVCGTLAYEAGAGPGGLSAVRFVVAGTCFWLLVAAGRRRGRTTPTSAAGAAGAAGVAESRLSGRQIAGALALGALGYATQSALFFGGLERVDAGPLSLILYTYPVLVTVAAILLRREAANPRRTVALVAASVGVSFVLLGAGVGAIDGLGALMGFGAAVTYTCYILIADGPLRDVPPVTLSALVCTGAAAVLVPGATALGVLDVGHGAAPFWLLAVGLLSVSAIVCFFAGLRRVGPATASIVSTAEPLTTVVLAFLLLHDGLAPAQLAGGALVLGAVVVLTRLPTGRPAAAAAS
jgi:drug/metabolite transporter (DMT)-like permease